MTKTGSPADLRLRPLGSGVAAKSRDAWGNWIQTQVFGLGSRRECDQRSESIGNGRIGANGAWPEMPRDVGAIWVRAEFGCARLPRDTEK